MIHDNFILPKNRLFGDGNCPARRTILEFESYSPPQSKAYYNNGELGVYGDVEGKIVGN